MLEATGYKHPGKMSGCLLLTTSVFLRIAAQAPISFTFGGAYLPCSLAMRSIRLNTDLAKEPPQCLEYIVIHEMTHLLEATHNARFVALMDAHIPQWRQYRDMLNSLPAAHEKWRY